MRALVIGGTSGIGYGIARSLAKEGCNVTISGRSKERGEEIVRELKELCIHTLSLNKLLVEAADRSLPAEEALCLV
jgi:3-oxoacyl-[acyl-carrier protein] reductase